MSFVDSLGLVQVAAFIGLASAATWQWHRHRIRPGAYLACAFATLAAVLLVTRLVPANLTQQRAFGALVLALLAAFPWLLAGFAWSFEGRMPRWLRLAALGIPALAAWSAALPPFVGAHSPRTPAQEAFVVVFLLLWSVLAAAMAWRLWRAGGRQRLVRARMRLMSGAAVLLTGALLVASAAGPASSPGIEVTTRLLTLGSAGLFVAGFAPPLPLRLWWRRRSSGQFQRMQVALIGSATPEGVAAAVTPMLADLLGGGVAVLNGHGRLLASAQIDPEEAAEVEHLLAEGQPAPEHLKVFDVADAYLVVQSTPYTPVFGQDEYELVSAFSLQLRLALERAELFRSEQAARQEAQAARAALESTLYGLSHDLRSPSIAISGFLELLPEATDERERAEMLDHIASSASYLTRLVDALLELSRIGRTQTSTTPVDLEGTVNGVAQRLALTHPAATVRIDGRLPRIVVNPDRAEQLLDNLVRNAAVHAGRDDVTVTLSAERREDWLELSVADDGQGVPADEHERIFELFHRGSRSGGRGSGVGLGVSRRIAEAAGGTLELAPSHEGARFVLRLPASVVIEDPPADGSSSGDRRSSTAAGRR